MWGHWQKGDSLQQISQLFDRNHPSIERILSESGGIRPAQRRRSRLALNNISKKSTMPIRDWKAALNRFTIQFEKRMPQQ